ncbi:head-tail joining protein [Azospirillum canadense]|uniref:head-tail joining protein n=1 Tax=Azospirillum canadense TaxID=403962 RepID=UPI0022270E5C|nr:hypothetical protein [Azospirillum canadense]MCW2242802.1 hypothetical protein [Azospirillum canadense]
MANPFQRLLDSTFLRLGTEAVYTPPDGGAPVPCWVTFRQPDAEFSAFGGGVTLPARIAEVRAAEVAAPEESGTLAVAGQTYRITRATQPDADRRLWRLELQ